MIVEETLIPELFSRSLGTELTINQVAKLINKSYAYTNKYVHEYVAKGILNKKVVGSALLCSLNYSNDYAQALLTLQSLCKRAQHREHLSEPKRREHDTLSKELNEQSFTTAYRSGKTLVVVGGQTESFELSDQGDLEVRYFSVEEFRTECKTVDYSQIIIMSKVEQFWKLVSDAVN